MNRRKGEDTAAKKRRRLPFRVVLEREEPFCLADDREIEAECRRITNGAEYWRGMQRIDGVYRHVVHFAAEHQAEAFRDAAHRSGYAKRPVPQFGPAVEEREAFKQAVLLWGFRTGAIRRVLKAWRNTPGSLTQRWSAAQQMVAAYRPPQGPGDIADVFVQWCVEHHPYWLEHRPTPGWLPFDEFHWVIPQGAYPHSDE